LGRKSTGRGTKESEISERKKRVTGGGPEDKDQESRWKALCQPRLGEKSPSLFSVRLKKPAGAKGV